MNNFMILGDAPAATNNGGGLTMIVIQIGFLGLLLYFMLIRPQKKQQKKMQALLSTVATGDSILTSSGFYGVVIDVMEEVVIVEFGNNKNCRIPMKKNAIVEIEKVGVEKA
ncbi:MAG TPA: preprotein translocase subunit YajC [Mobilitalea sp.]|nr:preprotein translocase subunit YajC [Mobilitalea sp.]